MTGDTVETSVVQFNFGLSWKQIAAGFGGIVAMIGAGTAAGWLSIPYANKTDVTIIEKHITGIRKDIGDLQSVTIDLTDALRELQEAVATLKAGGGGQASPQLLPTRKPASGAARKRGPARPPDTWREGRKVRPKTPTKSAWQFPSFDISD